MKLRGVPAVPVLVVLLLLVGSRPAMAVSSYQTAFTTLYPSSTTGTGGTTGTWSTTSARCNLCHSSGGGTELNAYGAVWAVQHNSGLTPAAAYQAIEGQNSDGDPAGTTNIAEITANAQPGWRAGPNNTLYDLTGTSAVATGQSPPSTLTGSADPAAAPANRAPSLTNPGNKTVSENQLLTFTLSASDPDGNALTFSGSSLPTGATVAANGTFSWTPSFTQAGNYTVTAAVTDNGTPAMSASQTFTISVGNVNRPPAMTNPGNKTVNENQSLTFALSATDPDGDALTFSGSSLPTGATVSAAGAFSWTPSFTQAGNYTVTATATDTGGLNGSQTFTISVGNVNRPPAVTNPGNKTVSEGQTLTFAVSATDPDGDALTFSGSSLPTGATLAANGTFSWTPASGQAGSYTVTAIATDTGTLTGSAQFTITVGAGNRPPVLGAIGDRTATEGQPLTFAVNATDPDGGALTFSGASLPTGATLTPGASGVATFAWTPTFSQAGSYPMTVTVTDAGGLTDSETFTITVGNVNRPPVLSSIGNRTATEGQLLTFAVNASDPDGGTLTISGGTLPAGASLTPGANGTATFAWTPAAGQAGNYSATVTVTDDGSLTDSETFTITVGNVNRPPVLSSIGNRTATEGQLLTFAVNASDPDGGALTISGGTLPGGASLTPGANGTATFAWTPSFSQAGNYPVTVTARDAGGLTASETFAITVGNVNRPPVMTNPGNKTVNEGQALAFTIAASDPDGDALTFASANLPSGATLTPGGAFTWTPAAGQAGSYPVTVTVTDAGTPGETASQAFTITVQTAPPPPTGGADLRIRSFRATEEVHLGDQVRLRLTVAGTAGGSAPATLVGMQNRVEVYRETVTVSAGTTASRFAFPSYTPRMAGDIRWTVTLNEQDPDSARATTEVKGNEHDD